MADTDPSALEDRPTLVRATLVRSKTPVWRRSQDETKVDAGLALPPRVDLAARYREQELLGEGGMGKVSVYDDRQIGRRVAVKQLHEATQHDGHEQLRFVREARIQAQLEHPAVVPVYDLGVDAEGRPWFAMKRISGVTLAELIDALALGDEARTRGWTQRRLLTAMSQVCLAVDFVHQRGVLHRDLKPENIMLGEYGEVYVLDWGLAKELGARGPSGSESTQPGTVLGTPGFMSPEQVRGMPLERGADVFALGAILFELLTLEPLLPLGSVDEMLRATLEGVEARPSVRAPEREVSPELEALIVRALAPDPRERFASARDLSEALEAVLHGERDLQLRAELAAAHASDAARLLAAGQRREAVQALGRALALEPDDPETAGILRRLLTQAPAERPAAVAEALQRSMARQRAGAGKLAALAYFSFMLFCPVLWWAGVRDLASGMLFFVTMAITSAMCFVISRRKEASRRAVMTVMVISNIGLAGLSTWFGPLILLPSAAAVNTTTYALLFTGWRRTLAGVAGAATMLVPLLLELAGGRGSSYEFSAEGMLVLPQAIELSALPTMSLLVFGGLASVITGVVTAGYLRSALLRAEERLFTYAWQIEQLLPESARDGGELSVTLHG